MWENHNHFFGTVVFLGGSDTVLKRFLWGDE